MKKRIAVSAVLLAALCLLAVIPAAAASGRTADAAEKTASAEKAAAPAAEKAASAAADALALPAPEGLATTPAAVRGIDVSVWQGQIDFAAVKADGIQAVFIRAGEGEAADVRFAQNAAGAAAAGMDTGYYWYVTARSTDEARRQAEVFWQTVEASPAALRPAVDFESLGNLSRTAANEIALAFLQELEAAAGMKPLFYSDAYRVRTLWDEAVAAYPLWLADWSTGAPERLPDDLGPWETAAVFQYSNVGAVRGITGDVDLDRVFPAAYAGSPAPQPENPDTGVRGQIAR